MKFSPPILPCSIRISFLVLMALASPAVQSPSYAQAAQAPVIITKEGPNWRLSWKSELGRTYFVQYSTDLLEWHYQPYIDYGDGSVEPLWCLVNADGSIKNYFRLQYSDDPSTDYDGDGLSNEHEIENSFTNPLRKNTDNDSIEDGEDPNPTTPDDASPGVYVLQWQKTDSASLTPVGWGSESTSAPKPNFYRKLTASAVQIKSSNASGQEYNIGKNMTIGRILQEPVTFAGAGWGKFPVYLEAVTWSHSTGRPFVSMTSHQDPGAWGSPAPGAIASRIKYPNPLTNHDYTWDSASPVTNGSLIGEFHTEEIVVPTETLGSRHTWTHPPVNVGGNRYQHNANYPILLPNVNFPSYGDVIPGGDWITPAFCLTSESNGTVTTWTLEDRWTYAYVREKLDAFWPEIHASETREDGNVQEPGYALRRQYEEGSADVQTYQFRFRKIGGGIGRTTLYWPETFQASDNPETAGVNEAGQAPIIRLRSVTLPVNATDSPIYTLDPRVSPFTQLPGAAPVAPSLGSTNVGSLMNIGIQPDANMSGNLGDMVPSALPASRIKHFVSPTNAGTEPAQDHVVLIATGIAADEIDPEANTQIVEWHGGEAFPGQPLKRLVSRSLPNRHEVKIRIKGGGAEVATFLVWTIESTITATPIPITPIRTLPGDPIPGITVEGGYSFEHEVKPATLFTDSEKPKWEVFNKELLTGTNSCGALLKEGASGNWDVSRQIRGRYIGFPNGPGVPCASQLSLDYPTDPVQGNDDSSVTPHEDNYPQFSGGFMSDLDLPKRNMPDMFGVNGDLVSWKLQFREFTRLQIGQKWYRISPHQLWRIHINLQKVDGKWQNAVSAIAKDNDLFP